MKRADFSLNLANTYVYTKVSGSDMLNFKAAGFQWDSGNTLKCLKHGLTAEEIELFFNGEFQILNDLNHSSSEKRFIAVGYHPKNRRPVFIAFTLRNLNNQILIRPVSARYMHKKESRKYGQKNT